MKKTYSEKLKDPQWQKKRLEIMSRDGFRCCYCGNDKSTISVHHEYYVSNRDPWQYPNWSLKSLCESCHGRVHSGEIREFGLSDWEGLIESVTTSSKYPVFELCEILGAVKKIQAVAMEDRGDSELAEICNELFLETEATQV